MANITVSNPYNFNINNNTRFNATINAVLPDEETILYRAENYIDKFINLTIPSGVNVVKVYCYADIIDSPEGTWASASVNSHTNNSHKNWAIAEVEMGGTYEITKYIGVTPGKAYKLKIHCSTDNIGSAYLSISYSSKINTHTVDVEDY